MLAANSKPLSLRLILSRSCTATINNAEEVNKHAIKQWLNVLGRHVGAVSISSWYHIDCRMYSRTSTYNDGDFDGALARH